jgi:hypothetical protein
MKYILIVTLILLMSCSTSTKEINEINAGLYIPMLKEYIREDKKVDDRLKDTYFYSLDLWYRSLKNEL